MFEDELQGPGDRKVDIKTKAMFVFITAVVFMIMILVVCSFGSVSPTEYGILYSSLTKQVDPTNIYGGGLMYTGFFNTIITFPSIHRTIEFSDNKEA